jgi:hypothetical protein
VCEEYLTRPGFEPQQRGVNPSKNVACLKSGDLIMALQGHIAFGYMPIGRLPRPDQYLGVRGRLGHDGQDGDPIDAADDLLPV